MDTQETDREDVRNRIARAINLLIEEDRKLLDLDANERSITHKLAEHLADEFPCWHVDCEYNRWGTETKELDPQDEIETPSKDDDEAKTVFPDIIVHRRNQPEENFLVIEVKKTHGSDGTKDRYKLECFTELDAYRYDHGFYLEFRTKKSGRPDSKLINKAEHYELNQDGEPEPEIWTEYLHRYLEHD